MDDDVAARRMISALIEEHDLGTVCAEAADGLDMEGSVLRHNPAVLIIDLLMPGQDGIETIRRLKCMGYEGKIVMISQVEHKEMVSEAYQQGVEYYIHKPINRIEVATVLKKVIERIHLEKSIQQIRHTLQWMDVGPLEESRQVQLRVVDIVRGLLTDLGVVGEVGSRDLIRIIEYLTVNENLLEERHFPPLKELYSAVLPSRLSSESAEKEIKAIEQRIRRTVAQALLNVASRGLTDYFNPTFELYSTKFFDFADVRQKMREMEAEEQGHSKVRLNVKKFIYALYLDVMEKRNGRNRS